MTPKEIGIFETKAKLSEFVQRVAEGESFYITRRGQRIAELRPVQEQRRPLVRGAAKNTGYWMAEDFDSPLDDMKDYM